MKAGMCYTRELKVEHRDSKYDFLRKKINFVLHRLILWNVFFKMTHVLPLISAQNCDKKALQNRRDRQVLNVFGSLIFVFSVLSFRQNLPSTQFLPHNTCKSMKDITMYFGSLIENSLFHSMKLF